MTFYAYFTLYVLLVVLIAAAWCLLDLLLGWLASAPDAQEGR